MNAICSLCNKSFTSIENASDIVLNMEGQNAVAAFSERLAKHLYTEHGEIAGKVEMASMQYRGFLIIGYFRTQDPVILQAREETRKWLHTNSRALNLSDAELLAIAEQMSEALWTHSTAGRAAAILPFLQRIREALVEQQEAPAVLTTAGLS